MGRLKKKTDLLAYGSPFIYFATDHRSLLLSTEERLSDQSSSDIQSTVSSINSQGNWGNFLSCKESPFSKYFRCGKSRIRDYVQLLYTYTCKNYIFENGAPRRIFVSKCRAEKIRNLYHIIIQTVSSSLFQTTIKICDYKILLDFSVCIYYGLQNEAGGPG